MVEWDKDFWGNRQSPLGRLQGRNWFGCIGIQGAYTFLWWGR